MIAHKMIYRGTRICLKVVLLLMMGIPGGLEAGDIYVDPSRASREKPGFRLQGDYIGTYQQRTAGVQVLHVQKKHFHAFWYPDGLPGSESSPRVKSLGRTTRENGKLVFQQDGLTVRIDDGRLQLEDEKGRNVGTMEKITRSSRTMGSSPPSGGIHLYDGSRSSLRHWENGSRSKRGFLKEGTRTRKSFRDFKLHLEFRIPYKSGAIPASQSRGNSGVYIFNRYEVQLLDSFGLPYHHLKKDSWANTFRTQLGFSPNSHRTQWCGALYHFRAPRVNMSYPPLVWQTFDLTFTAPRFKNGKKVKAARLTVRHNGVLIHKDLKLPHGTGQGKHRQEVDEGRIYLQNHGNPVRFRNIWVVEK